MTYVKEIDNISNNAYGAVSTSEAFPVVSGSAYYNFIPSNFRTFLAGAGTATAENQVLKVTSGTSLGDYGVIRSFRSVNYQTGQGARFRLAGMFTDPLALTWSGIGAFNIGDELSFGYAGTDFGIWHRHGGLAEVQELQITTPAGGAETATITINSVEYTVSITSGTAQHNAYEIATDLDTNGVGFEAQQLDDKVIIDFTSDGDKTGTFSFSSTGSAVGAFTELTAGILGTDDFYPMSSDVTSSPGINVKESWNGTIPDGFDPTKGNTYEITYQNGYGDIHFFIEHPLTGYFVECHTIRWSNHFNEPNLLNPSLRVGIYCYSIGATTATTVESPYVAGFIDGVQAKTRNPRSFDNTKNIGTTLTNILTIRNSRTYNGYSNQVEIEPVYVTFANDGTKTAVFEIRGNPTVAGEPNYQQAGNNIVAEYDTAGTTVTENGRYLGSFVVAKGQSLTVNLTDFQIRVPPSLRLVIAGKMTSGTADLTASLTWYEDI